MKLNQRKDWFSKPAFYDIHFLHKNGWITILSTFFRYLQSQIQRKSKWVVTVPLQEYVVSLTSDNKALTCRIRGFVSKANKSHDSIQHKYQFKEFMYE